MTSDQILDLLNAIAAEPGKLAKEAMLKCADCPELRRVLVAALDPLTTYGIAKLPEIETGTTGAGVFDDTTWMIIEQMAQRVLTGEVMRDTVWHEMNNRLSQKSAELLGRILTKDLKSGFGDNTTNKAFPGLIREFPYMRCSLPKGDKLKKLDWAKGIISQEKADGMFLNVNHVAGGAVMLFSRAGTMFPTEPFGALIDEIRAALPVDHQAHGEMLVLRDSRVLPREEGNGVLNHVAAGGSFADNEAPYLMLWDLVPLSAVKPKGRCETGYAARLGKLITHLKASGAKQVTVIPTRIVKSQAEAFAHYKALLAQGKEGTILKELDAIWRDGTSAQQFKLKLEVDVDLQVVGTIAGNGKNAATFGSLVCRSSCGGLEVCVSGFTDKLRQEIHTNLADWLGSVISVRANGIMRPSDSNPIHSLFLPRYVERRHDKREADCLTRVIEQFDAAVAA